MKEYSREVSKRYEIGQTALLSFAGTTATVGLALTVEPGFRPRTLEDAVSIGGATLLFGTVAMGARITSLYLDHHYITPALNKLYDKLHTWAERNKN